MFSLKIDLHICLQQEKLIKENNVKCLSDISSTSPILLCHPLYSCQSKLTQWSVKIAQKTWIETNTLKISIKKDQKAAHIFFFIANFLQHANLQNQHTSTLEENRTQLTSQIPGILRIIAARTFTLFNGIVILWSFHGFVWCARGTGRVCAKWFAAIEKIL